MKKEVDISNIYSLKYFINSNYKHKEINEYFKKNTHTSRTKEYRPDSESWLKCKEEDEMIQNIPDHNVKITYDDLVIKHSYKEVRFTIGTITTNETNYDYDMDEYIESEVTKTFVVKNSYWGYGLICSFDELITNQEVQELFEQMLDEQRKERWRDRLETTGDGVFMLLLNKILKCEKNLINSEIYRDNKDNLFIQIGEEKYYGKDLIKINESYKNNDYEFYDSRDRKIVYSDYLYESFPDFYLQHTKNHVH